jgi:hypothetical protein
LIGAELMLTASSGVPLLMYRKPGVTTHSQLLGCQTDPNSVFGGCPGEATRPNWW